MALFISETVCIKTVCIKTVCIKNCLRNCLEDLDITAKMAERL